MPAAATQLGRLPNRRVSRGGVALIGLVALAVLLRFWRIDHQSFWLDEAFTAGLVRRGFGDMLATIPRTESTPPLYYILAWLWARLFGSGEAGLRTFSAVAGTLTVPVAYGAARELFSVRVALIAATLVALNPYFVWYSQEARSYALLVLLTALSVLLLGRLLRAPTPRALALWALVAVLALLTHYFAIFVLLPEGVLIVRANRSRLALLAVGAPLLCTAALAPLALHQRASGHTRFIGGISLAARIADIPKKLVTGELGLPLPLLGALAGVAAAGGIVLALERGDRGARRNAAILLAVALTALVLPLALAILGADYFLARNAIAIYVPLVLVLAAGFGAARAGRAGLVGASVVALVALCVNAYVAYDPSVERDDWRGAARALGPARGATAVVLTPAVGETPLALYAGPLSALTAAKVLEVDVLGNARPVRFRTPPAPPGFHSVALRRSASYELIRYRAERPTAVTAAMLAASRLGQKAPAILLRSTAAAASADNSPAMTR